MRYDTAGKPLNNQRLPRGRRRVVESESAVARRKRAGALLAQQIRSRGVQVQDLPDILGLDAKTTLPRHIASGKVTLSELLQIADFYPLDINSILDVMRDPRVANVAQKHGTGVRKYKSGTLGEMVREDENLADIDITDNEEALIAEMGLDSWGE